MKRASFENQYDDYTSKVRIMDCAKTEVATSQNGFPKTVSEDLRQLAMEIDRADTMVHSNTCNKLVVISQQMQFLSRQAQEILKQHQRDKRLHHAACNFIKVPGQIYHLYQRPSGEYYFSMLSPEEWNIEHKFSGSYRLELDQSWTDISQIESRDSQHEAVLGMFPQYPQLMN